MSKIETKIKTKQKMEIESKNLKFDPTFTKNK